MNDELAKKLSDLAARVNTLAVSSNSPALLALQDRLTQLAQVAIIQDLSNEKSVYQAALQGLNGAIDFIENADRQLDNVAKAIALASKAADLADKAISTIG